MERVISYRFNNLIYVYSDKNDENLVGREPVIVINTEEPLNRMEVWGWIQNKYGSLPNKPREDIKPSLEEVIDDLYNYLKSLGLSFYKIEGRVEDNLGIFTYDVGHYPQDSISE